MKYQIRVSTSGIGFQVIKNNKVIKWFKYQSEADKFIQQEINADRDFAMEH